MSTCTRCGTEGAYVGINDVKCKNPECPCYDSELWVWQAVEALDRYLQKRGPLITKPIQGSQELPECPTEAAGAPEFLDDPSGEE